MTTTEVDFRLLFEQSPDILLVLLPDAPRFSIVGATRARHLATHTKPEQIAGKGLFEMFPDNPGDPAADGARNLRASLMRVVQTKAPDTMAVQKYDIRNEDGTFVAKYWSPRNIPVLSAAGELQFILHRVEDVTELVRAGEEGQVLRDRSQQMEREVIARSRELASALAELRDANARLGELDSAKTAFFSNVSHEFRTPLTLMLGPLEDALDDAKQPLPTAQASRVRLAHDNALRLLKLVNALLDFSRLEAGRLAARFAPIDLAKFTAELAAMFHSAFQRANVALEVDCPPLSESVWVDLNLWEKIVPNLVSNAFKFTQSGSVTVRLRETPEHAVLEVSDTGIGIPQSELPHLFDRFHRVPNAKGRTHEGAGIGLSLVRELTLLHGGSVTVDSTVGKGSTFSVQLPKGNSHLSPQTLEQTAIDRAPAQGAVAYAVEATRWVAPEAPLPRSTHRAEEGRATVLLADDNRDLRNYVSELLAPDYDVSTVTDGQEALEAAAKVPPDIVLSDVMMPRLDGIGLTRALRANPQTATVPIILLSARAGDEAAVEGLDTGADDYLVKPFSARELVARVRTHVNISRARRKWAARLEAANRELDAFSYSVSHDLRAPLRAIEGFSNALLTDPAVPAGTQAHDYLIRIQRGARDMSVLISDLLELARLSRSAIRRQPVDLAKLAEEIVASLREAQPGRQVVVALPAELHAIGDANLLRVVLANLIGNAWKFTAKVASARIEVGKEPGVNGPYFVRDNGAGFDMAHVGRLFAPFQRLHDAAQFEGTGIGLATVQRIVTRHGGRVWAKGAVGEGTTVYFELGTGNDEGP